MRLDKFLCDMDKGTRSQVKKEITHGLVTVNGAVVNRPEYQIDENADTVCYRGTLCHYEKFVYYMLHKPAGMVSAVQDNRDTTVVDLLQAENRNDLFPVGRLDKNAEGLLLLTNDGELAHALLSPARHVEKEYVCYLAYPITESQIRELEQGVDIGEAKKTKPAVVKAVSEKEIILSITEGKFHQIKRMLKAVGNEVVFLKRVRMGTLALDETLPKGAYRRLTEEETAALKGQKI